MTYSIEKITTLIGAHRYGDAAARVSFLLTDSRSLCFPEETMFFAITTAGGDGHRYIGELYQRGVRNFCVENLPANHDRLYPDANFLKVAGTRKALQRLAERHRDEFQTPVVGITGSNGKTMVKEWLSQLLAPRRVTRSPRSYNSQVGVPLSVWLMDEQTEVGVFEAGISQPGEMRALQGIIQPTIAVLTNLGDAHQENFPTLAAKCREKMLLFHDAQAVVYPADNDIVRTTAQQMAAPGAQHLAWSQRDAAAALYISSTETHDTATTIRYQWHGLAGQYTLPFADAASVQGSFAAAAVALSLGLTPEQLAQRMATLEPVAMRMEVKDGQHGCTLINDSYNSDINSLDIALDFMQRRPETDGRRHTLILSDIKQSGRDTNTLFDEIAALCRERGVDKFIGIGDDMMRYGHKIAAAERHLFPTVHDFVQSPAFQALHDEVVLIKGARQYGFDRITDMLVQKVHETTLEVNLDAMVANLNHYRAFMRPDTHLVCMIKANGYGTGAEEIAQTLQEHRVDYLAVAVADEGAALRRRGITANIMVMNPEMSSFKTLFDYRLEPEVYSFRLLDALVRAARAEGITRWPVHIKLDTGMHRLGFNPEQDIDQLIDRLKAQQAVTPRSVFSHFVGSDSNQFDDFSARQFDRFDRASQRLQQAFSHHILRHIDNSAGIEHFPGRQLDMCRLGLGLYGINPRDNSVLHNVATLKTTILQMRNVPAGDSVGYSRKTVMERDSVVAAIPIGYADGLNRHLGNRHGYCLVRGHKAPYVGNICMDVAMIDVTGIECQEGDSVEIFGDHLPVAQLSDTIDTIPYEILTGVSERVKRVYFKS